MEILLVLECTYLGQGTVIPRLTAPCLGLTGPQNVTIETASSNQRSFIGQGVPTAMDQYSVFSDTALKIVRLIKNY